MQTGNTLTKMDAEFYSKTLVNIYQATGCYTPEYLRVKKERFCVNLLRLNGPLNLDNFIGEAIVEILFFLRNRMALSQLIVRICRVSGVASFIDTSGRDVMMAAPNKHHEF